MRFYLTRHISFLSIFLALFFFTASVSAFYAFEDQQAAVGCCDKDEAPQSPVEEGECFDCQCLTCSVALSSFANEQSATISDSGGANWLVVVNHPSDYIQLIEYPPEAC